MNIHLTPAAKEKLVEEIAKGSYMKIDLTRSGCCSYGFTILAAMGKPDDHEVRADGLVLAVSNEAYGFLKDITIDYRRRGIRRGFQIQPQ